MVVVSPSSVLVISRAVLISGRSSSLAKSTSTTGPMTRTTLPVALPFFFSAIWLLSPPWLDPDTLARRAKRLRSPDDLHDLRGDLRLPCLVRHARQDLDELFGVLGCGAHGPAPGSVLRRGRLEQGAEHPSLDVARQQRREQRVRIGLENVLRRWGLRRPVDLFDHQRNEATRHRGLPERRQEVSEDPLDLVHLS